MPFAERARHDKHEKENKNCISQKQEFQCGSEEKLVVVTIYLAFFLALLLFGFGKVQHLLWIGRVFFCAVDGGRSMMVNCWFV